MILVQNRRKVDDFSGNFFRGDEGARLGRAAPKSWSPKGPARDLGEGLSGCYPARIALPHTPPDSLIPAGSPNDST